MADAPVAGFTLAETSSEMSVDGGEGGKAFRLPPKNINNQYLMSCLLAIRDFDRVVMEMKREDDPRFYFMAREILNRILDDKIKYKLIEALDTAVAKETTAGDSKQAERNRAIIKLSQDAVGEFNNYLDEFFGLHKGQIIGEV